MIQTAHGHSIQNRYWKQSDYKKKRECQRLLDKQMSVPTSRRECTQNTHTACMTYSTVCSQARTDMKRVLVAQELNGSVAIYHLRAPESVREWVTS